MSDGAQVIEALLNIEFVDEKQIPLDSVKEDARFYPREMYDDSAVNRYRLNIDALPPIAVTESGYLLDGKHRLIAHRIEQRKEILAKIYRVPEHNIRAYAIYLNSKHGLQLSLKEKKAEAKRLFNENRFSDDAIGRLLGVSWRTVHEWLRDAKLDLKNTRKNKVLELCDKGYTQEEIANELSKLGLGEVPQRTISRWISEQRDLSQNCKSAEMAKHSEDSQYTYDNDELEFATCCATAPSSDENCQISENHEPLNSSISEQYIANPSDLKLYNVWNFAKLSDTQLQYPGQLPEALIENIIYYWTEPGQLIWDPFAGSGIVGKVAARMGRRCVLSDINPIDTATIHKHDILEGLPEWLTEKPDLIFLDPPYWIQAADMYTDDKHDLANMNLEEFYAAIRKIFLSLDSFEGSRVAIIIQDTQWKNNLQLEPHIFRIWMIADNLQWNVIWRGVAPYSTQQYTPQQVETAKEKKISLVLFRDLVVFEIPSGE